MAGHDEISTKSVARKGRYEGWETGGYLYSDELKSLMTREQAKEYEDNLTQWKKDLEVKRARDEHATSFVGVDGVEYQLAPGLDGILELEDCSVKACKRYGEGKVTWEDLKAFLVYFPYAKSSPTWAILTEEGNAYPDGGRSHPRQFSSLNIAVMNDDITFDQKLEIIDTRATLLETLTSRGISMNRVQP